jgi:predicted lipoprotein with Yx(FWY)xxD motif
VTGHLILAGLLAVAAVTAGCGGTASVSRAEGGHRSLSADSGHRPASVVISMHSVGRFGDVLVSNGGYALYMFKPDKKSKVTCIQLCAGIWPPLQVPAGSSVVAGPGVRQSLLSSDPNPDGGRVATYGGWPLYTYDGDALPGQATGQGVNLDGGNWFLMQPSGQPLMARLS